MSTPIHIPMTNAARAKKANAARQAKQAAHVAQMIVVDAEWSVARLDYYNWEIRHHGKFAGYYGNVMAALKMLPVKMLNAVAAGDLKQILAQQAQINQTVEAALKNKSA